MRSTSCMRAGEGPLSSLRRAALPGPGRRVFSPWAGPARRGTLLASPPRSSQAEASVKQGVLPPGRCSLVSGTLLLPQRRPQCIGRAAVFPSDSLDRVTEAFKALMFQEASGE
ncbi:hypothetical protein NDU88_004936 [Pleurodeles waltl]|uniref:Uncharacterized protein n=1 Tax=Pleurodeles waltl TaxID=8319 RepID=A0AAV7SKD0_PLEWA|nr:hypothetical protein NDU88_004936 [Pleurodeles waltl]